MRYHGRAEPRSSTTVSYRGFRIRTDENGIVDILAQGHSGRWGEWAEDVGSVARAKAMIDREGNDIMENPLSTNEKIALGVAAVGVVGAIAYFVLHKPSSSSSSSTMSYSAADIAKAAAQGGVVQNPIPSPNPPAQKPPILAVTPPPPPNQLQQQAQQVSQIFQNYNWGAEGQGYGW